MAYADKIRGSFLLGAIGDTLGAPLEGVKDLKAIIAAHGEAGLSDIIAFRNAYGSGKDFPPGRITDDTTMAMTTVAAVLRLDAVPATMTEELRTSLWQGYLNWAQYQEDGEPLAKKIDASLDWPEDAGKFWFYCGAGRGTIAALMQEKPGTVAEPLTYDCIIRGRETKGPNAGCGGMMRVAPLALIPGLTPEQVFELGCESAAITHGHADAFVATGAVALLLHFAAEDVDMVEAVQKTAEVMKKFGQRPGYKQGVETCLAALDLAKIRAAETPGSLQTIDKLPKELGYDNAFLAAPVLAQTAYALLSAPDASQVKAGLVIAANHSGDSDSVAAIVGNVLGARHGTAAIPKEWLGALTQKTDIEKMADDFSVAITTPQQSPAPKRPDRRP